MRTTVLSLAAAAGLMFGTTAACLAQNGAQDSAPGQRMQDKDKGSIRGQPGASGYGPTDAAKGQQAGRAGSVRICARPPGLNQWARDPKRHHLFDRHQESLTPLWVSA